MMTETEKLTEYYIMHYKKLIIQIVVKDVAREVNYIN